MNMKKLRTKVSHYIKGEKLRKKISYETLAKEMGIKKGHLNELATEKTYPNIEDILKIKDYKKIKFGHFCTYLEDGSGKIEDFEYRTVRASGDLNPWLKPYGYLPWLEDVVKSLCALQDDTRRELVAKLKHQRSLIDYIATIGKIDNDLLEVLAEMSKRRRKK